MLLSNKICSQQRLIITWTGAVVCALASAVVPFDILRIVLLGLSYGATRLLWKLHLLNKAISGNVLLTSTGICGAILIALAVISPFASSFFAPVLLIVSDFAFIAVSGKTFDKWVFVPREAMRTEKMDKGRKLFAFTSRCAAGISFGAIAFSLSPSISLVEGGLIWLVCATIGAAFIKNERLNKRFPKGVQRAYFAAIGLCVFELIPIVPTEGKAVLSAFSLIACVSIAVSNAISHFAIRKDEYLSDVYLSGSRLVTDSAGSFVGYFASYASLSLASILPMAPFIVFGVASCFVVVATLRTLHAFDARDVKTKVKPLADPWHVKMLTAAQAASLTPRQTQIFDALSRGRNAKYIQERLYLSEGTVKKQIFQIYKKLDVHTQQDLITHVLETEPDLTLVEKEQKEKAYDEASQDQA